MAGEDTRGLRRSTRARKPISYKSLLDDDDEEEEGKGEGEDSTTTSPQPFNAPSITEPTSPDVSPSESDDDDAFISEEEQNVPRRRGRPHRDSPPRPPKPSKKPRIQTRITPKPENSKFLGSRDIRFNSMAGNDEEARQKYMKRLQIWRDVLTDIPEELLEYTAGWGVCQGDWAGEGGERQRMEPITEEDSKAYFTQRSIQLVIGPKSSQHTIILDYAEGRKLSALSKDKHGHIINVSQPIWGLDFLPQPPSSKKLQTQYLALSGYATFPGDSRLYIKEAGLNVIQLWGLDTSLTSEGDCYLSTTICHDWGSCWGLTFCPYGAYGNGRLGLLAGAFNDGVVRVIDIREDWLGKSDEPVYIKISEAAWEYSFGEEYVATCVAWKSHTEIIVGVSNGFVAIFDLSDSSEDRNIPTFYSFAVDSYILSVTSLAPLHPPFLALSAYDGTIQLVDIRSPQSETALSLRQRAFSPFVIPFPFWGGLLSPNDICGVHFSTFRPVKRGLVCVAHEAAVWDVAASQGGMGAGIHPFVLTVGSDGVCNLVSSANRIFTGSKRPGRKIMFKIEHVDGAFRFSEDFKFESQDLSNIASTKVFPDEVGVTKVVWCMNKGYTGWYAVGMACGLLRIENINAQRTRGKK